MDKKSMVIIVISIAIIIVIAGMIMLNINTKDTIEYETLNISDTGAMSVL